MGYSYAVDFEALYRAAQSRDARFDGRVFVGVTSTGVYCRPTCPTPMPRRDRVRFFPAAAAAEEQGFRACRRCRPEASPDSPDWDVRADLVGRGLRLIAEGVLEREGVDGLARRLAVGSRHLRRTFVRELGAGPLAIAKSRRARLAKQPLERTDLAGIGDLTLRLSYRPPFATAPLLGFLGGRAIPGVEEIVGATLRRSIRTSDGSAAVIALTPHPTEHHVVLDVSVDEVPELGGIVRAARRLFDLDADPSAIDVTLSGDPILKPLVGQAPGIRLPGTIDPFELVVRAVLGQQVSVRAATTLAGRIAAGFGTALPRPAGRITHLFPTAAHLAEASLDGVGLTGARAETIRRVAELVALGKIDLTGTADVDEALRTLGDVPGIGAWTSAYVAMRALRDPDAFPATDLGVRRRAAAVGLPVDRSELLRRAERWRPWRGYAAMHLWNADKGPSGTRAA